MRCNNCGEELSLNDKICPRCGAIVYQNKQNQNKNYRRKTSEEEPTKKTGIKLIITIIVLVIIAVLVVGIIIFVETLAGDAQGNATNNTTTNAYSSSTRNTTSTTNSTNTTSSPEVVTVSNTITNNIKFNGYIFSIPKTIQYREVADEETLSFANEDVTWITYAYTNNCDFKTVLDNKDEFVSTFFEGSSVTASNIREKKVNGQDYLLFEATEEGGNALPYLLGTTALGKTNTIIIFSIETKDGNVDENILNELEPIFTNAKKEGETKSIEDEKSTQIVSGFQEATEKMQE